MNKYVRAAFCVPFGIVKLSLVKLHHFNDFKQPMLCMISPLTEISLDKGGKLSIGKNFKMRDGAKIRVRNGAECVIGNNTSINTNNIIACREKVIIGDNVQMSPNVQIYDHDHDFRVKGGISSMKYKTSPVIIGNNVWIGAGTIILRGTTIGDNSVVGAGTVVKGIYPENSLIYQKREITVVAIGV